MNMGKPKRSQKAVKKVEEVPVAVLEEEPQPDEEEEEEELLPDEEEEEEDEPKPPIVETPEPPPTMEAPASIVPPVRVDLALTENLQNAAGAKLQLFLNEVLGASKMEVHVGNRMGSESAPGFGSIHLVLSFSKEIEDRIKAIFQETAETNHTGVVGTERKFHLGFHITSLVDGKMFPPEAIQWLAWAGKPPRKEGAADLSKLKPEWLGQSFLWLWPNGWGWYWNTIVGLSPNAKDPVLVVCNDTTNTYEPTKVYGFKPEVIAQAMEAMEKVESISAEMLARKPQAA
jgi:hypothetical protein